MDGQIIESQRAKVLVQALPYIQKDWNRVVVIEYGGSGDAAEEVARAIFEAYFFGEDEEQPASGGAEDGSSSAAESGAEPAAEA